jgi:hypothetical protein
MATKTLAVAPPSTPPTALPPELVRHIGKSVTWFFPFLSGESAHARLVKLTEIAHRHRSPTAAASVVIESGAAEFSGYATSVCGLHRGGGQRSESAATTATVNADNTDDGCGWRGSTTAVVGGVDARDAATNAAVAATACRQLCLFRPMAT